MKLRPGGGGGRRGIKWPMIKIFREGTETTKDGERRLM